MKPIWTQAEPGAAYSVPKRSSWLIYAMGGGWGHLTRSLALARVAASKYDVHILTNSPYADLVTNSPVWQNDNFKGINIIKPESIRSQSNESTSTSKHNPAELLAAEIEAIVERHAISFLVVDTFPRGILGELPQLLPRLGKTNLVLVQRDISPDYSSKYNLLDFVRQNYKLVIDPGDCKNQQLSALARKTSAWVIRSCEEFPNRNNLRLQFGINTSQPFVLVCASGRTEEQYFYARITERIRAELPEIEVRCLSASAFGTAVDELRIDYWPGIDCIYAADIIIGAGGYNTISECAALKRELIAFPQKRLYDRQNLRIEQSACKANSMPEMLESLKKLLLSGWQTKTSTSVSFKNGAAAAFELIEQLAGA